MRLLSEQRLRVYDQQDFRKIRGRICRHLTKLSNDKPDYWNFCTGTDEVASRKLFQYPAMMVPALQKQVIAAMLKARPETSTIFDPFIGSGTTLALAMLSGRAFIGQDINPLAILIAKTRAFSLDYSALSTARLDVLNLIQSDCSSNRMVRFIGQSKWFTDGASLALSKLRNAIRQEASITSRRFLWVCLAETIRLNSNSRTSTFKLHVKPPEKRNATEEGTLSSFATIASKNLSIIEEFVQNLEASGYIKHGQYVRRVRIDYGDSVLNAPVPEWEDDEKADLIVTSPHTATIERRFLMVRLHGYRFNGSTCRI